MLQKRVKNIEKLNNNKHK